MGVKRSLIAVLVLLPALFTTRAFAQASPVPASIWDGRLWLTSQALGLAEDCPVRVLFQHPKFRSTSVDGGGVVTSRLVSERMRGGDLLLTIDTLRDGRRVARVTLQLRAHPSAGIVSVESIELSGAVEADSRTLTYEDAADDDEDYDVYTDTLVSLYQAFFDAREIASRR